MNRRRFLHAAAAGTAIVAGGGIPALSSCGDAPTGPTGASRTPLPAGTTMGGAGMLIAAPGSASIETGRSVPAWLYNGALPGPTIRMRRGEGASLRLVNQLPDPTIVHWHGLVVPDDADGHPRDTIAPGSSYQYDFPIVQRAGTFWYHPHAHHSTAGQVQRGLAGFFIIEDDEESALHLPQGEHEVLLLLQDRDENAALSYTYAPSAADLTSGILRNVPFGNGVQRPTLAVDGGCYRLRILNASHSRIYRLALDTGTPLTVIGNDGGLLPSAIESESVYLGVGERLDLLVDFSQLRAGNRVMLQSLPFMLAGDLAVRYPQGIALDLLEFVGTGEAGPISPPLPPTLSSVVDLSPTVPGERTFVFTSGAGDAHQINGLSFAMDRVDERIPLGQVERWIFQNDSTLPHPVHLHGTHFQVVARSDGRNRVYPYERGWKDTVLVMPAESVEVLVQFTTYRGLYLLHCHNLQHEDAGMMLNVEVF